MSIDPGSDPLVAYFSDVQHVFVAAGGKGQDGDYHQLAVDRAGCVKLSDEDVNRIADAVVSALHG